MGYGGEGRAFDCGLRNADWGIGNRREPDNDKMVAIIRSIILEWNEKPSDMFLRMASMSIERRSDEPGHI